MSIDVIQWNRSSAAELVERFVESLPSLETQRRISVVIDTLAQRVIRLLRTASRNQLAEESCSFFDIAEVAEKASKNEIRDAAKLLGRTLTLAVDQHNETSVDSILASYKKRSGPFLEMLLHSDQEFVLRRDVKTKFEEHPNELAINESHLSHMLRDFEKANLIVRVKAAGTKHVAIGLTQQGKKLALKIVPPKWPQLLQDEIDTGLPLGQISTLYEKLCEAGLPAEESLRALLDLAATPLIATSGSCPVRMMPKIERWPVISDYSIKFADTSGAESIHKPSVESPSNYEEQNLMLNDRRTNFAELTL